mmetsp:Transcript_64819/g.107751  ORF Transcript_64819/g.107751 Transcript_64819/m.107751 type:complete len:311 (-) Transcript_64819:144-1076(-)
MLAVAWALSATIAQALRMANSLALQQFDLSSGRCNNPRAVRESESAEERLFRQTPNEQLSNLSLLRAFFGERAKRFRLYFELQDRLDRDIWQLYQVKPTVLVVGANNGVLQDHLFPILIAREWGGLLIEAVPCIYEDLLSNYRRKHSGVIWPTLFFRNTAISHKVGTTTMNVDLSSERHVPYWARGTGHLLEAKKRRPSERYDAEVNRTLVQVKSAPLYKVLSSVPIDTYDLVQIDVEGYDEAVLTHLAEWLRHKAARSEAAKTSRRAPSFRMPRIVCLEECFESCHGWFVEYNYTAIKIVDQTCGYRDL